MKKILLLIFLLTSTAYAKDIEKQLLYTKYTLPDSYLYNKTKREFRWTIISQKLDSLEIFINESNQLATLTNYKNFIGIAPLAAQTSTDEYGSIVDLYNVPKTQSVPLYYQDTLIRYGKDGSLVAIIDSTISNYIIKHSYLEGEWNVPKKYVKKIDMNYLSKIVIIDIKNQNITTLELLNDVWLVRSMNPVTTGQRKPPYQRRTPVGIFVLQAKTPKMIYHADGTKEIGGYAPYASRFCCGGYIHGVPVNLPAVKIIEYSTTLGTTPRSHMCVRNATSHAKFIYDWAKTLETIIYTIE